MIRFQFQSEDGSVEYGEVRFSLQANAKVVLSVITAVCKEMPCVALVSVIS
jgi:hypothetical protein